MIVSSLLQIRHKDFYKFFNCKYIDISQSKDHQAFDFGVFDSKEDLIEVFDKIKPLSKTWIAVDSTKNWVKEFGLCSFSFFFCFIRPNTKKLQNFETKFLFGVEYVLKRSTNKKDDINMTLKH